MASEEKVMVSPKRRSSIRPLLLLAVSVASSACSSTGGLEGEGEATAEDALSTATCAYVSPGSGVSLSCPSGQVIKSVAFASYGTPTGTCGSFALGSCNARTSTSVVSTACLGKAACQLTPTNALFGDPCVNVAKHFAVQVTCGTGTIFRKIDFSTGSTSQWDLADACSATYGGGAPLVTKSGSSCIDPNGGGLLGSITTNTTNGPDLSRYSALLSINANTGSYSAAELINRTQPLAVNHNTGVEFVGISYYFPSGQPNPKNSQGITIGELSYPDPTGSGYAGMNGPPIDLTWDGQGTPYEQIEFRVASGASNGLGKPTQYSSGWMPSDVNPNGLAPRPPVNTNHTGPFAVIPHARMTLDVWHHVIIEIKWTTATDGYFEAWHKREGVDSGYTVTVPYTTGWPTLQYNAPDGPSSITASTWKRDKIDAYTWHLSAPLELRIGGYVTGSDFNTVAAALGD
jgi:hypothetical protein